MPNIFILVLNWNHFKDTSELIRQLEQLTYPNKEIVIIDNASEDGSGQQLKTEFSNHHYLQSPANLGFAGGNNLGLNYAIKHNAEFIWILNNDVSLDDFRILEKLLVSYQSIENIGFLGCKVLDRETKKIQYIKAKINAKGFPEHPYAGLDDTGLDYQTLEETDYVQGACMFFKSDLILNIGYMQEDYFLYYEETDWCMTAKQKGYKHFTKTDSQIYHDSPNDKTHMHYYMYRNYIYFSKKFGIKIPLFFHSKNVMKESVKRIYSKKKTARQKGYAILKGTWDGVLGKRGML